MKSLKRWTHLVVVILAAMLLLYLGYIQPAQPADGGASIPTHNVPLTGCDQKAWQCVRCDRAGRLTPNLPGGGCMCKFCVSPVDGKTIDNSYDLREISCVDRKT